MATPANDNQLPYQPPMPCLIDLVETDTTINQHKVKDIQCFVTRLNAILANPGLIERTVHEFAPMGAHWLLHPLFWPHFNILMGKIQASNISKQNPNKLAKYTYQIFLAL